MCWLSISFKISTNTRTIRVTTAIQLNTATNSTAKKSPIHAAYKQSPTLTLHTPNTKLKPIKNHVSRAVTELGGFSSLWLFLCLGSSRWKFLLLASSSNFKCIPSRSEIFSAEHKNHVHTLSSETSRFLAKGSKSAVYTYILCYFHFTTPHYAAKYCVLLSKKNIDNIKIILPIPVNLSWLGCQISGFYFH